jgi:hypothetical protein
LRSGMVCTLTLPRLSAYSPKSGETSQSECASICLYTTVEGAQTPHIGMTWM